MYKRIQHHQLNNFQAPHSSLNIYGIVANSNPQRYSNEDCSVPKIREYKVPFWEILYTHEWCQFGNMVGDYLAFKDSLQQSEECMRGGC